ncbi:unnamed protein product [Caretta caretta]
MVIVADGYTRSVWYTDLKELYKGVQYRYPYFIANTQNTVKVEIHISIECYLLNSKFIHVTGLDQIQLKQGQCKLRPLPYLNWKHSSSRTEWAIHPLGLFAQTANNEATCNGGFVTPLH